MHYQNVTNYSPLDQGHGGEQLPSGHPWHNKLLTPCCSLVCSCEEGHEEKSLGGPLRRVKSRTTKPAWNVRRWRELLFGSMSLLLRFCEPGQPSSVNPFAALNFTLRSDSIFFFFFLSHHPSSFSSFSCVTPQRRQRGLKCRDLLLRLLGL